MTPDDLSAIHQRAMRVPSAWSARDFREFTEQDGVFLTAMPGVGFALGRTVLDEVELLTIAVAPACQGMGHGRAILDEFEAMSVQRGASVAYLEVAVTNLAAQKLYRASGWTQVGCRKDYYRVGDVREDALLFSKTLRRA